jgi:hypothetical protein
MKYRRLEGIRPKGIVGDNKEIGIADLSIIALSLGFDLALFVGKQGWLVHNANSGYLEFERLARVVQKYEVLKSGVPINTTADSGNIDLVLNDNGIIRLAEVGGGAKTFDGLGIQLTKLQRYASQYGGTPTLFL